MEHDQLVAVAMDGEALDKECPNEELVRFRGVRACRDDRNCLELHELVRNPIPPTPRNFGHPP